MGKERQLPEYHVIDFVRVDDENQCTLIALIHHIRYHVIVDPDRWDDSSDVGSKIKTEFNRLITGVKRKEEQEVDEIQQQEAHSRKDDDHLHDTCDSGIDIPHDDDDPNKSASSSEKPQDPRTALYDWILSPLIPEFSRQQSKSISSEERTVQDWYHSETAFYHLVLSADELTAKHQTASGPAATYMKNLIPSLKLPKYITNLDIPTFNATDLCVCAESADPAPIHPTLVRDHQSGNKYFLKVVDPRQPQPTKREIRLLKEIEKKGIHEEIRVPLVRGLVRFPLNSETNDDADEGERSGSTKGQHHGEDDDKDELAGPIMGFLLDPIEEPTPLTLMLDADVAQARREKWASAAEQMVACLHNHGIVWGDAKGDNFVVDRHDDLWIIDFGGSYTPGWIDPELNETVEGDEQGVRKLVNGLMDPEENTLGHEEGANGSEDDCARESGHTSRKRRRTDEAEVEGEECKTSKQPKLDKSDDHEPCFCGEVDSGKMIACDGQDCKIEWFHMSCVGIDEAPKGKWYCDKCKAG